jgi:hypothetical protein
MRASFYGWLSKISSVLDWLSDTLEEAGGMFEVVASFQVVAYVVARITLLVLAFTSLRSLPPEAYQTVRWTTFIPHI